MKSSIVASVGLAACLCGAAVPEGADVVVGPEGKVAPFKTAKKYGDVQLHFEWLLDARGDAQHSDDTFNRAWVEFPGAARILVNKSCNADGREVGQFAADRFAGAVEMQNPPIVNATRSGLDTWNSMDVIYRVSKWEGTNLVRQAEITVFHNGVLVQDHWGAEGDLAWIFRPSGLKPQPEKQPILFTPAWSQKVSFRNVWVREI